MTQWLTGLSMFTGLCLSSVVLAGCGECPGEGGVGDFHEPTLCQGTVTFLDHYIELNLASAPADLDATDDFEEDGTPQDAEEFPPQSPAEVSILIEGSTKEGRPAENYNIEVAFLDQDDEGVYDLLSIESGENCRENGRRVHCSLDVDGRAEVILRATGFVPGVTPTSIDYTLHAWSRQEPPEIKPKSATPSYGTPNMRSIAPSYYDAATINVGLFDIANSTISIGDSNREIDPSVGVLTCQTGACTSSSRSQLINFKLSKVNGEPVVANSPLRIFTWLENNNADAWLAYEGQGCNLLPSNSNSLRVPYNDTRSADILLCAGPKGGEVEVNARLEAYLPAETLPTMDPQTFVVAPDPFTITLESLSSTVAVDASEMVTLSAYYCEGGTLQPLPNARVTLSQSEDALSIDCGADASETCEAVTGDNGEAVVSVTGLLAQQTTLSATVSPKNGECSIPVDVTGAFQ